MYETVDAVRDAIGHGRILGIRMYDDLEDWGLRLDDYKQVARLLEAHGRVDYFNMWQGIVPSPRSGRTHWPAHYYARRGSSPKAPRTSSGWRARSSPTRTCRTRPARGAPATSAPASRAPRAASGTSTSAWAWGASTTR